jgi:hypothetical protein
MTLFEWALAWWRKAAPVPERRVAVVAPQPATPRVGARYLALYTYLERRYASNVVLTFEQMEALLGFSLPAPASTERDWWTSPAGDMDRHSDAWTVARRTATPNLLARTVAFERLP